MDEEQYAGLTSILGDILDYQTAIQHDVVTLTNYSLLSFLLLSLLAGVYIGYTIGGRGK